MNLIRLLSLPIMLVGSARIVDATATESASAKNIARSLLNKWERDVFAKDSKAVASLFAEDVVMQNNSGLFNGPVAVHAYWQMAFNHGAYKHSITLDAATRRGDVIYSRGEHTVHFRTGGEERAHQGLWRKCDGARRRTVANRLAHRL